MRAVLMLEDGKSFSGKLISGSAEALGEVVFNTAVVGYQEMLTDPANAGKILVFTYPLIGNYGCAPKFNESKNIWPAGLVIKEKSRTFSNWQARSSFDDFIKEHNLLTLGEVDTRTLAVHLRQKGEMLGIISTSNSDSKELLSKIMAFRKKPSVTLLPKISVAKLQPMDKPRPRQKRMAVLDLGTTKSITRQLQILGFSVTLLPYDTQPSEILRLKPHGLIISNGPEDDTGLKEVVNNVRPLIGRLPILGISTGHQVLALALGGKITKMKLGHRGVNYPIHNPVSYKGEITVQNHSYAVDADSLGRTKEVKITAYNLNDRTVEEIESRKLKLIGTQYCPVSPGLEQANEVFKRFSKMLAKE